jgi:TPR repeat protein
VEAGDTWAMMGLGRLLLEGRGVPRDQEAGLALYRQALEAGNTWAMQALGWRYRDGIGVPIDKSRAGLCFWGAADRGDEHSERHYGRELHALAYAPV